MIDDSIPTPTLTQQLSQLADPFARPPLHYTVGETVGLANQLATQLEVHTNRTRGPVQDTPRDPEALLLRASLANNRSAVSGLQSEGSALRRSLASGGSTLDPETIAASKPKGPPSVA